MSDKLGFTSAILHSDKSDGPEHGSIHKPIHVSLAYGHAKAEDLADIFQGKRKSYSCNRMSNPTASALEDKIAKIENGRKAVVFSASMVAIFSTIFFNSEAR